LIRSFAQQLQHFLRQQVQVDQLMLHFVLAEQAAQPLYHFAGALIFVDDVAQDVAYFLQVGLRPVEETLSRLSIAGAMAVSG